MNGATFDALAAAGTLRDAGFADRQAEAVAGVVRDGRAGLATKADLDSLEARMETRIVGLEARLYRALRLQGGAIIAILAAIKFFG